MDDGSKIQTNFNVTLKKNAIIEREVKTQFGIKFKFYRISKRYTFSASREMTHPLTVSDNNNKILCVHIVFY